MKTPQPPKPIALNAPAPVGCPKPPKQGHEISKRKEALLKQIKTAWRNAYALSKMEDGYSNALAGLEMAMNAVTISIG